MRGENEQKCLNIVRNNCSSKESLKKYFGLFQEDIEEIDDILRSAKPNDKDNQTVFPDFVFENGFIEHFQITSSKTNKKGAEHLKKLSLFKNEVEKEAKRFKEDCNTNSDSNKIRSKHLAMKYPEHNYEYLCESFKKNWENHIASYNKYMGNKNIGIFMIEYTDNALEMYENVYNDWVDFMTNGDLREPENVKTYRLTRDKALLNYIYSFKENMKYVMFVYEKECEIIKLENIPYLLKILPWDYVIAPYMGTTLFSSIYSLNVQNPISQKGKLNNE